jgi:hypothetical protein
VLDAFRRRPPVGTGSTLPARIGQVTGQSVKSCLCGFQFGDDFGELWLHASDESAESWRRRGQNHGTSGDNEFRRESRDGTGAHENSEGSRLDNPSHRSVVQGESFGTEHDRHGALLSRCKAQAAKSLKGSNWLCDTGNIVADVDLHHFLSDAVTGVAHIH